MSIDRLPVGMQKKIVVEVVPDCPVPGPCWIWTGCRSNGYGRKAYPDSNTIWQVHRLTYTLLVGDIEGGLQIDHLCLQKPCCNPAHLEPVTAQENTLRFKALKTHCLKGHPFSGSNLIVHTKPNGRTMRVCRECKLAAWRAWSHRQSKERSA